MFISGHLRDNVTDLSAAKLLNTYLKDRDLKATKCIAQVVLKLQLEAVTHFIIPVMRTQKPLIFD